MRKYVAIVFSLLLFGTIIAVFNPGISILPGSNGPAADTSDDPDTDPGTTPDETGTSDPGDTTDRLTGSVTRDLPLHAKQGEQLTVTLQFDLSRETSTNITEQIQGIEPGMEKIVHANDVHDSNLFYQIQIPEDATGELQFSGSLSGTDIQITGDSTVPIVDPDPDQTTYDPALSTLLPETLDGSTRQQFSTSPGSGDTVETAEATYDSNGGTTTVTVTEYSNDAIAWDALEAERDGYGEYDTVLVGGENAYLVEDGHLLFSIEQFVYELQGGPVQDLGDKLYGVEGR